MHAHARVVAEVVAGRTRPTTLRSDPPLTLREGAVDGRSCEVHLVGSAAGPVGGDDLRLDVVVRPGADLLVRSVAASLALPAPRPARSHLAIDADVAPGAALTWSAQPTILVRGCDHHVDAHLRLGAGCRVVWREELVLGRWAELPGSVRSGLRADLGGRPLLRHDLVLGPAWEGSAGPAGAGRAGAVGSVLVVGPDAPALQLDAPEGVRLEVLELEGPAVLVLAVEQQPGRLGPALDAAVAAATAALAR